MKTKRKKKRKTDYTVKKSERQTKKLGVYQN